MLMSNQRNNIIYQFNELINSSEQLRSLLAHLNNIKILDQQLHKYLAFPLNSHCSIANYSEDTLIIRADTPAWATKLRYHIPSIQQFAKHKCNLTNLKTVQVKCLSNPWQDKLSPNKPK